MNQDQKTLAEINELKRNWSNDPCWDIEDTEGFEAYKQELLAYRLEQEAEWKRRRHDDEKKALAGKLTDVAMVEIDRIAADRDEGKAKAERAADKAEAWLRGSDLYFMPEVVAAMNEDVSELRAAIMGEELTA